MTNTHWAILIDAIIGTMGIFSLIGLLCAGSNCLKQARALWRKEDDTEKEDS